MNKYKISSLYIKNFKCITESEFIFDGKHLVVYDGPNGYGKTTCFEAIEILFAGTPRKSKTSFVDKRYKFKDSPIHKNNNEEIIISAILKDHNGNELKIKRIFPSASKIASAENNFGKVFTLSKLYINETEKESSVEQLEELLHFENIEQLFNLLNYVEQDENTYFLKKDPKNRYSSLESLLGGEEQRSQLLKVINIREQIKKKKIAYTSEIQLLENNNLYMVTNSSSEIQYSKLLKNQEFDWDQQEIRNIDPAIHQQHLSELNKIEYLVNNTDDVKKIETNQIINSFLNTDYINLFLKYFWSVTNFSTLKTENERRLAIDKIILRNSTLLKWIEELDYKSLNNTSVRGYLLEKPELSDKLPTFISSINRILMMIESLSIDSKILSDLKEKREQLIRINLQHRDLIPIKDSECPTCGYDWDSSKELLEHIDGTEAKIFSSYLENNAEFERIKKEFNETTLESVRHHLSEEVKAVGEEKSKLVDEHFFAQVMDYSSRSDEFKSFINLFDDHIKTDILNIVDHRVIGNFENAKNNLAILTNNNRPIINEELDQSMIRNDFSYYFESSFEKIASVNPTSITEKKSYIQWQFYNAISQNINFRHRKVQKLDNALAKLNDLAQSMEAQINNYTKSIVEKIKIPFHIYTGKILQNHSLGSGLNIDFDMEKKDKQLYITPCYKDQEVAFTLSSGQLSATVISLMLVLNKVFNHSQLAMIFIDDPLQTLDEINAHSLVELLKYNFSDQQIVLSTHEDRYSRFIRYKFDKFGLSNKNINMREWQ